jgi:hypothetical protein
MKAMQCRAVQGFVVSGAVERESIDRWTIKPAPVTFAVDRAGPYVGQGSQLPSNPIHPSIHQRVNRERLSVSLSACHLFPPAVYCSLLALHCSKLNVVLKNLRNTTRKFMHAYVLAITIYYMQMHDGSNIFMACIY